MYEGEVIASYRSFEEFEATDVLFIDKYDKVIFSNIRQQWT